MKKILREKRKIWAESLKNTFLKEREIQDAVELVFVVFAFSAIMLPVACFSFSRDIFFEAVEARPDFVRIAEKKKEKSQKEEAEERSVDTSGWKKYSNAWYGFEISHPEEWEVPKGEKSRYGDANFEYRYMFREKKSENGFSGFDVVIYDVKKNSKVEETDELWSKDSSPEDKSFCGGFVEDIEVGSEKYPAKLVSVGEENPCYQPAYFLNFEKNGYHYNIVPVSSGGEEAVISREKTKKIFPELEAAISTLKFFPVKRPKPKPVITAPKPDAKVKKIGGKSYCAKKNDKPRKSKAHKEKHLDMECCLDPDEYPNPWCTY